MILFFKLPIMSDYSPNKHKWMVITTPLNLFKLHDPGVKHSRVFDFYLFSTCSGVENVRVAKEYVLIESQWLSDSESCLSFLISFLYFLQVFGIIA